MTTVIHIALLMALVIFQSCNNHSDVSDKSLTAKDSIISSINTKVPIDTPRSFVKNYGIEDNNPLFVFVGEKVLVEPIPTRQYSMDNGFKAKYVILQKVFGDFLSDTIEFVAYDHYGIPPFSKFTNVLLFVSADSGLYYHQKYMYNDVYKAKDGRWAGTYAWEDYAHENNKHTKVKPVRVDFLQRVSYPNKMTDDDGKVLTRSLPKPYFETIGDSSIAIYGNYVEELFILKRDGYLTARELFKKGNLKH